MVDDCTRTRHFKRPEDENSTSVSYAMCTMVAKKFPEISGIPRNKEAHNPAGLDIAKVVNFLSSDQNVRQITRTSFASHMPAWMKNQFFDPENEMVRLTTHQYAKSADAQKFRKMTNLQLINFVELPLKSKDNLTLALKIICSSKMSKYLNEYYLTLPDDIPCSSIAEIP